MWYIAMKNIFEKRRIKIETYEDANFQLLCKVATAANFDQINFNPLWSDHENAVFILIYKIFKTIQKTQRERERKREFRVCKKRLLLFLKTNVFSKRSEA